MIKILDKDSNNVINLKYGLIFAEAKDEHQLQKSFLFLAETVSNFVNYEFIKKVYCFKNVDSFNIKFYFEYTKYISVRENTFLNKFGGYYYEFGFYPIILTSNQSEWKSSICADSFNNKLIEFKFDLNKFDEEEQKRIQAEYEDKEEQKLSDKDNLKKFIDEFTKLQNNLKNF